MVVLLVENPDVVSPTLVVSELEPLVALEAGDIGDEDDHDDTDYLQFDRCQLRHYYHDEALVKLKISKAGYNIEVDDYNLQQDYCHLHLHYHQHQSPIELCWDVLDTVGVVVFIIGVGVFEISLKC